MLKGVVKKIVGSRHGREVKRLAPLVDEINGHFADLESLPEDRLQAKTEEFRERIRERTDEVLAEMESLKDRSGAPRMPTSESSSVSRSGSWRSGIWPPSRKPSRRSCPKPSRW